VTESSSRCDIVSGAEVFVNYDQELLGKRDALQELEEQVHRKTVYCCIWPLCIVFLLSVVGPRGLEGSGRGGGLCSHTENIFLRHMLLSLLEIDYILFGEQLDFLDADDDGLVDEEELKAFLSGNKDAAAMFQVVFKSCTAQSFQFVHVKAPSDAVVILKVDDAAVLVKMFDKDGSGKLDVEEMCDEHKSCCRCLLSLSCATLAGAAGSHRRYAAGTLCGSSSQRRRQR
jgi:hypothetical protein